MRRVSIAFGIFVVMSVLLVLVSPKIVFAHEDRNIAGKYDVEAGWFREPAAVNRPNAAFIGIFREDNKEAVIGVEKTLKVRIAYGGNEAQEFELKAVEGEPGHYIAEVLPTRVGSYVFTFVGKIEDTEVNEKFESGPGRFDDIAAEDIPQIPQPLPDPITMAKDIQTTRDELATARTLAIVGLVVGVAGLLAGLGALTRGRK
jgi:hypothetical protein